ncbi:MAG: two-component regulator propeller domain-containing protein [Candidatus Poribacteria bacterium]|nr:two-component regulator propeller domain-containing protein [Candidatus Poribacteria bacterium]
MYYRCTSKLIALFYSLFFIVNIQAQTWRQFTKDDGLPSDTFYTMISDQEGNIWVGMSHAISRINNDIINESFQISQSSVTFLMESSDGSIWVLTRPSLYRYDQKVDLIWLASTECFVFNLELIKRF